ncbi:MAG: A/G-specific adenine glycosylase [Omnitrophica bacterium RIFCSPHIGHO2_02_FULL_46_11]|nr:MAG: A/G-specific adenine glycosylase [Omnitrophica bacterium RIFCSPHIGHO2_02_FULL_46_11]
MNVNVSQFQKRLISWFLKHQRPLPWRVHGNPYRIFVVEVMLQQTQMNTVIPYYKRWLKVFPNVGTLSRAPLDQVLKLWEGLGYYTRARNLHKASKIIVTKFGGKIPSDLETLQSLPGIGRYTAGAIASIAFQKPVSLVDGNVMRVLSRVFHIRKDIKKPDTQKLMYQIAKTLIPEKNPGIFNQALMELGSLVCVPEIPKCPACPIKNLCLAYQKGDQSKLPIRSKTVEVKEIEMVVGILAKNGKFLIRRRPNRGIWGGLWEIPGTMRLPYQKPEEALKEEFKSAFGISIAIVKKVPPFEHRFTHRKALIRPFQIKALSNGRGKQAQTGPVRWVDQKSLNKLSFPVPHQKILGQYLTLQPS